MAAEPRAAPAAEPPPGWSDGREAEDLASALADVFLRPARLLRRWNWKAAFLSALVRGSIFFATNVGAGLAAGLAALLREFVFRAVASGFFAALTQSFRRVRPAWHGTLAALVLLPLVSHSLELVVHWIGGTPNLLLSIAASAAYTVFSTLFHLHVMRQGALIVGRESQRLDRDLLVIFGIVAGLLAAPFRRLLRARAAAPAGPAPEAGGRARAEDLPTDPRPAMDPARPAASRAHDGR